MEVCFLPFGVIALGGDLVLTPKTLGDIGSDYVKRSRQLRKSAFIADLFSSDACQLPFRDGFVDAVVSDLPFGQSCLSAAKLDQVLPLILHEVARVLKPGTGRAVLLCGSYVPVLQTLKNANENSTDVWILPCTAIFPVNIGGLVAWIVQVNRGTGTAASFDNCIARVRKLVEKRERVARMQEGDKNATRRRLQS